MNVKEKPKYNAIQNIGWMVKIAWKTRKRVLMFCVLTATLEVLLNLTQHCSKGPWMRGTEDLRVDAACNDWCIHGGPICAKRAEGICE